MRVGDRRAFDRFFERHAARILVFIHYNLGPKMRRKLDAADVLQNLYLRLYEDFAGYLERAQELGTRKALIRWARHEITEAYRFHFKAGKRNAARELSAIEGADSSPLKWQADDAPSVSAQLVRKEELEKVLTMLRALTPHEQTVTVARVIEGLTAQEIAERLGKSRTAVQMTIARSRDKLRALAERENAR